MFYLNKFIKTKIIAMMNSVEKFTILPAKPLWKTKEDKLYYYNQLNGNGYCSSDVVY